MSTDRDMAAAIAEVAAIEQRRIDALLAGDPAPVDEIVDPDCIHVESTGQRRSKTAFLDDMTSGRFSFDLFEILDNDIRIFGDTAVAAGTYRNVIRVDGRARPVKYARHLRVYARRGGRWRLVAHQATEMPAPAG